MRKLEALRACRLRDLSLVKGWVWVILAIMVTAKGFSLIEAEVNADWFELGIMAAPPSEPVVEIEERWVGTERANNLLSPRVGGFAVRAGSEVMPVCFHLYPS